MNDLLLNLANSRDVMYRVVVFLRTLIFLIKTELLLQNANERNVEWNSDGQTRG